MKRFVKIMCAVMLLVAMIPGMGFSTYAAEKQQADGDTVPNSVPIQRVTITVDAPVAGAKPDTLITVVTEPEGCFSQSEFSVSWLEATKTDLSDKKWMNSPVFEPGKIYILDWPHNPALADTYTSEYHIYAATPLTINGNTGRWNSDHLYVFDRLPADIAEIRMSIDEPVAGHLPDTTLSVETVPAEGLAHEFAVSWGQVKDNDPSFIVPMTTEKFQQGETYVLNWPMDPNIVDTVQDGFSLTGSEKVYLNGNEVEKADDFIAFFGPLAKAGINVTVDGSGGKAKYREMGVAWNDTATLKVSVEDSAGSNKYQWYTVEYGDYSWDSAAEEFTYAKKTAISGATKSSYTTPVIKDADPHGYACIVTDSSGKSSSALFFVTGWYDLDDTPRMVTSGPQGVDLRTIIGVTFPKGVFAYVDEGPDYGNSYFPGNYKFSEKFKIYRKESGGKWAALKTYTVSLADQGGDPYFDYTDSTAKMGTTYAYRFKADLNGVWSPYSKTLSVTFNPFVDVSLDEERAQYIAWAYNNDVVKGSLESDGHRFFHPDDPCTRMNFVMILWKMHGKPTVKGSNPFKDVSGTTSVNAVKWAVKKGLVTGTSATTFSPDDNLSRINIIMILYKLAGSPKASTTSKYEDISGSKTTKAVNWAVKKGIIAPLDPTHFGPNDNCNRALLVEVLCKYNDIYKILA